MARCSSGNAFDCRSRGPWFESYTGLKRISMGTRNESPSLQCVNWYPERVVPMQVLCLYCSWAPYFGCTQNREWNIFAPGKSERLFLNVAQWPGEVIVKGGWTTEWLKATLPKQISLTGIQLFNNKIWKFISKCLMWTNNNPNYFAIVQMERKWQNKFKY